ncbi:biopolymer transporter ExbD [uncultured Thiothrix sp.]|uniref:ExbD/TolR family protein n=1 Tax=uncultured Thiothrix sp. TaxID=223185 RepID=UPI0026376615|nr:biopolymer transporter ExbD [uncultured Thiothrix sp.]HMT92531.1 biopolymer transporter ExbD [Thiolinea sp.]
MKFRTRETSHVDVDLTSMIDVVFLLLIFFMVTTTFNHNSALKIALPTASKNPATQNLQNKIELLIDSQGRYYVNGREVLNTQPETLFQAMTEVLNSMQGTPALVISADANVNYQAVVTAMDIAGRLGLTNFSMATTQAERQK